MNLTWRGFVRANNSIAREKAPATRLALKPFLPKTKYQFQNFCSDEKVYLFCV